MVIEIFFWCGLKFKRINVGCQVFSRGKFCLERRYGLYDFGSPEALILGSSSVLIFLKASYYSFEYSLATWIVGFGISSKVSSDICMSQEIWWVDMCGSYSLIKNSVQANMEATMGKIASNTELIP